MDEGRTLAVQTQGVGCMFSPFRRVPPARHTLQAAAATQSAAAMEEKTKVVVASVSNLESATAGSKRGSEGGGEGCGGGKSQRVTPPEEMVECK